MGAKTEISWTDATWNPIRGCSMAPGSELGGCLRCYAARLNARNLPDLRSPTTGESFARILPTGPRWTGKVEVIEKQLLLPLKWRKPKRIFVNSMSDLFHEALSDEDIDRVFAVMALCPQHTFQVLTKRPGRMLKYFAKPNGFGFTWREGYIQNAVYAINRDKHFALKQWPLPNLWLGVSIENQKTADARIPILLKTPAAIRFVSYEPALGPIDFDCRNCLEKGDPSTCQFDYCPCSLDWVICGGESGPGARPMEQEWAQTIRDQCVSADIPFFFKQWGENCDTHQMPEETYRGIDADGNPPGVYRVGKKRAGAFLDGVEWKQFPRGRF